MRSTIIAATAALAFLAPCLSSASAAGQPAVAPYLVNAPLRSRHASRSTREDAPLLRRSSTSSQHKLRRRCKASHSSQKVIAAAVGTGGTIEEQQNNSTSESSSSGLGSGVDWDVGSSFLKVGNIFVGFLPDDGSGGGKPESMKQINSMLPAKSAWYGRYAQVTKGKTFDGSQLYSVLDDVKESGAILAASVMPYGTWDGLTEYDNRNAIAIAKVCNDIYKNHGIEVFLRFAHEMNWYQVDGTYSGGVSDFQTGWKVLSKAIEEYAPETKLWWSPNVGSDADYERYYPKEGRVDIVGFDWYPNNPSDSFVARAKPFHDRYAKGDIKMIQGETGLHYTGSNEEKMQWVRSLSSSEAQSSMPNYLGWMHFNYDKFENGRQVDFKIVKPEEGRSSGINSQFLSFIAA